MADMPTSASDLFDNILPGKLTAHPDQARAIGAKYAFKISGEGGGEWTVDLTAEQPNVSKGAPGGANCTLSLTNEDFMTIVKNPNAGMQLFFQGKLKVDGDPMLATKLQKIFNLA